MGDNTNIYGRIVILNPQYVTVGSNCTLNEGVTIITKKEEVTIGDDVRISANAIISATGLDHDGKEVPYQHIGKPITIDDGVWIGSGAQIMPGVHVGRGCVIAAGSVVTRDVSAAAVVAGVPARHIR